MDVKYRIVYFGNHRGHPDHVQEIADGKLLAKYTYGYGDPRSASFVIYPRTGGFISACVGVPYTKKRVSRIRDRVEEVYIDA